MSSDSKDHWQHIYGDASRPLPISPDVAQRLAILFPGPERQLVAKTLSEEIGSALVGANWPPEGIARLQYAVLKLSEGDLTKLHQAIALAQRDWRDLLMAAGFGFDATAHLSWMPTSPKTKPTSTSSD